MELYTISAYSLRLDCFLCCVLAKLANEQTPILVALAAKHSSRELFETIRNMPNVLDSWNMTKIMRPALLVKKEKYGTRMKRIWNVYGIHMQ